MKTNMMTKYALLVLFGASFVAINNCGSQTDSQQQEDSFEVSENGPASDFAILAGGIDPVTFSASMAVEINCNDGADGDGDGRVDCEDSDCQIHPECAEFGPPLEEIINGRAMTVYPNGLIVPEDVAFLKARGADDDDFHGWQRDNFFASHVSDCWISPVDQDPYYNIPLGEALVAGPLGPIGPQTSPDAVAYFGPRAGLINECEFGTDIMFHHHDDDNGAGAGAAGDTDDDDGGIEDDEGENS